MNPLHKRQPDLLECVLEDRTLPASFIDSTFFLPPAFSASSSAFDSAGVPTAGDGNLLEGGAYLQDTYTAAYDSFGDSPSGNGLSPLDGVVAAYSQDTALSNLIGAGLVGAGSEPGARRHREPGDDRLGRSAALPRQPRTPDRGRRGQRPSASELRKRLQLGVRIGSRQHEQLRHRPRRRRHDDRAAYGLQRK